MVMSHDRDAVAWSYPVWISDCAVVTMAERSHCLSFAGITMRQKKSSSIVRGEKHLTRFGEKSLGSF